MATTKCYPQMEVGNKNYTEAAVVIIGAGISGKLEIEGTPVLVANSFNVA